MPKILEQKVAALIRKGVKKNKAYAIVTKQLQRAGKLKKRTQKLTSREKLKSRKKR